MTSQLKVDRISPANTSEIIIDGFGGGVRNIHKSFRNSDFPLTNGVWTRVLHNVNSIPNPSFSSDTGIFTVGAGDGGLYYAGWNCCFSSTNTDRGLRACLSSIRVNDATVVKASSDMKQEGPIIITTPATSIITLQEGDEVMLYAYSDGHTTGANDIVVGSPGVSYSSWTMFRIGDAS